MIRETFDTITHSDQSLFVFQTVTNALVVSWSCRRSIFVTTSFFPMPFVVFLCVAIEQHTHKSTKEIRRQDKGNRNLHDQFQTPEGEFRLIQSWAFHSVRYASSRMTGTRHGWSNTS